MGQIRNARAKLTQHRARALRRGDTDAEARLWNAVRAGRLEGLKWKRQVPFGPYIVDFLCRDAGLVVELDGGHHAHQAAYDARRTAFLERAGLRVLRVWNTEVLTNRDGVCANILAACGAPSSPPAQGAERERTEERAGACSGAPPMAQP